MKPRLLHVVLAVLGTALAGCQTRTGAEERPAAGVHEDADVRVGILVSHLHVTGEHWTQKPYSLWRTSLLVQALDRDGLQLHAVVEPGTKEEASISALLGDPTFAGRVVDGSDAATLGGLDVLVVPDAANADPSVTGAILVAQGGGLDLLIHSWYGVVTPDYSDPYVNRLHGIEQGAYFWSSQPKTVQVVRGHPILEGLKPGDSLRLIPNGIGGNLGDAEVLMEVKPGEVERFGPGPTEGAEPYTQAVAYVTRVGLGTVLQLNWYEGDPDWLSDAFYANAVRWLADRAMVPPNPQ